jgi:CubicO group peptidase (beta-lactamase class C family)
VQELAQNETTKSIAVVQHGSLVYERYLNGGDVNASNNIHSASKSILQALTAIAVEQDYILSLDDKIEMYLPGYPNADQITIRSLLEMKSGLLWEEDSSEYEIEKESDWVEAILSQELVAEPGTEFNYSTGNTHVLSAVIQAATGKSTCQFAIENLFEPLGITVEHWGRDPSGVYSGGYNLYLTTREMAAFGLLYLNNGVHEGKQVVPESAVIDASLPTSRIGSGTGYSQGWWTDTIDGHEMYFASGHGGQFIYVIPTLDTVLVATQSTSQRNRVVDIGDFIRHYLIPVLSP